MYGTVRHYSGSSELVAGLTRNEEEVCRLISEIPGFRAYFLIDAGGGEAVSVTIYDDLNGAEESNRATREWIQANLPELSVDAPRVSAGEVVISA
jgi:Uma2 family endonuclease